MTPKQMQAKSVEAQKKRFPSFEAYQEEMKRRASKRKVVGNFRINGGQLGEANSSKS